MNAQDPQQLLHDIAAAKADLQERAAQHNRDIDERIAALDALIAEVERGEARPRVLQARIRKIVGERSRPASTRQAGRTTIGLSAPHGGVGGAPPTPQTSLRSGPSQQLSSAALQKAVSVLDTRVANILYAPETDDNHGVLSLELLLLRRLREALFLHLSDMPQDSVLLQCVLESAEETQAIAGDLQLGGVKRAERILHFIRHLAGDLRALGKDSGPQKNKIREMQKQLAADETLAEKILIDALPIYHELRKLYTGPSEQHNALLFDRLLKN